MRCHDIRRSKFAWLLILVYVPMMLAIIFHRHSEMEVDASVSYCYDCAHHVHHDDHFSVSHTLDCSCALCQLNSLSYVVPVIVDTAAFVAVVFAVRELACMFVAVCYDGVLSTRAPPSLVS